VAVTDIKLNKNSVLLNLNETTTLTATVLPGDATDKSVAWESADDGIATVDQDGLVTGVAEGETTITVTTADGGKTAVCTVTVSDGIIHVTGVTLDKESVELEPEAAVQLSATVKPDDATDKSVTWESADNGIATVNQDGLVTGVADGETTITVTTADGSLTAECKVTVEKQYVPVTGVTIKASSAVDVTRTKKLIATVLPANATDKSLSWESSDANFVSVDQEGNITGIAEGEATITVTTADGAKTAACTVAAYPLRNEKWARSHIVWIEDAGKPEGGYLTFAVTRGDNADIPANVQGVFFKWGSLVAMSPAFTAYSESQILFSATGDKSYSWDDMPSFDNAAEDYLNDHDYTDDDFATYNNNTGFDAAADKGDICRYISSKGWVEGDWRMPLASEIQALADPLKGGKNVVWTGSTWSVIEGGMGPDNGWGNGFYQPESGFFFGVGATAGENRENPATGVAFAASGKRDWMAAGSVRVINSSGYAWSTSSYGTTTSLLHIYSYTYRLNVANRKDGLPVRCVRK
jgi:uncharacterized protein YjdB